MGSRHRHRDARAALDPIQDLFLAASTAFGAEPNTQANAVDIALPGVLPVLNKGAVECAIKFGLAVEGRGRREIGLRTQELLLPGFAQGLPDQPVRTAGSRRRQAHSFSSAQART
jgi:aspartyl-tRNA(Asn)/glutamyl-tRNA(Gln) amidotransferase subunit B